MLAMKIINFEDVKKANISPAMCYRWVSDMIMRKDDAMLPAKIHMNMPDNVFCNVMPSIVPTVWGDLGGVKIVTRYPMREPSLDSKILLMDMRSGEMLALMDGNWITAMRTGAVAAHSIMNFAKTDWNTVGIIGLGNTASASLQVLAAIAGKSMHVKLLRYKNQAEAFIKRFSECTNIEFEIVDTAKECIKNSDVVLSCATYFENDIAADEWFDKGVLVVPVHTRGFTNCDLFFDKIFADDTAHVRDFKNFDKFRYFSEVSAVVNGKAVGRENDCERILAYNIGVAIHDINYAANIYHQIMENKADADGLQEINFRTPVDKFWC